VVLTIKLVTSTEAASNCIPNLNQPLTSKTAAVNSELYSYSKAQKEFSLTY